MATPKKKHLIELMIEAGVKWPDGAEFAAQDRRDNKVYFFNSKPTVMHGDDYFRAENGPLGHSRLLPALCRSWHQTIVTREQYEKALADTSVTPTAQPSPEYCASVMQQMPDSTIEHLAGEYHARVAEAQRLRAIADVALKQSEDALRKLRKACKMLGLAIFITTPTS